MKAEECLHVPSPECGAIVSVMDGWGGIEILDCTECGRKYRIKSKTFHPIVMGNENIEKKGGGRKA